MGNALSTLLDRKLALELKVHDTQAKLKREMSKSNSGEKLNKSEVSLLKHTLVILHADLEKVSLDLEDQYHPVTF
jgi:hypothetical protein